MADQNQSSTEEKTEAPTQFRREEFRRRGHVALSKELLSVILLMVLGGSLYYMIGVIFKEFSYVAESYFSFHALGELTKAQVLNLGMGVLKSLGWMIFPVLGTSAIVGIVACVVQIGVNFTTEPLSPRWDRLNPMNGISRIISAHGAVEAVKALFKLSLALVVLWFFLKGQSENILAFYQPGVPETLAFTLETIGKLFFTILGAMAVMAILDYGFQRWQLEQQLRMTKKEAKDEFKLREGDPLIRQRIRGIQRRMASRRMMEAVPESDVVVTNPTHLSIALKYDSNDMPSPKVIAKGAGHVAMKIREMARKHHVPIVENKPLARTLFKQLEINQYIPRELYKAVAEVLAYVYRLRGYQQTQAPAHG